MPLNAEAVLAKATAGRGLPLSFGTSAIRAVSQPEYAIYLRGLKGPPLWVVKILYADDRSYLRVLLAHVQTDLELAFCIHEVDKRPVDYPGLAAAVVGHYVNGGLCNTCNGSGWVNDGMKKCGRCAGLRFEKWTDQAIWQAAGITRSSYSRRRDTYNAIVARVLTELDTWRVQALARIQRQLR